MTTLNYLTKTDLFAGKISNQDPIVQAAVVNQLIVDGLYASGPTDDGRRVWFESDIYKGAQQPPLFDSSGNPAVVSWATGLEVEGKNVTVQTDAALKVIVDDGVNSGTNTLNVKGDDPVWIGLGNSNTKVNLFDHGNDTVLGGNGSDTIVANDGNDSLVAGAGDTKLVGGSGHDTLVGGSGHDTLIGGSGANHLYGGSGDSTLTAGSGQNSWLQAGSGKTVITDKLSGGTDTLVAGSGPDTITGLQGDYFTNSPTMAASGNDVYNIYGSGGNSTINLGSGNDTVNFFSTGGNDTINNGGGVDTIDFTHSATKNLTDIVGAPTPGPQSGEYLIKFADGQTVQLNAHANPQSQDAFVLQFKDGTLNLQGGHL
jgi:Ca2+-binding RTX toxin-like protein